MYKDELSIFIPNSFLSESKDLKIRTYKVGILGRALAIFQADNVVIYNDDNVKNEDGENDGRFIAEVLSYMNTPQYLRKQAFPIKAELKHVGILPPLRTPHHPVNSQPDVGDYRQGFTVKRNKKGTFVDIGMDKLAFCKEQLSVKKIFDFKITKIAKKEVIVTPDKPDDVYWGYNVISSNKSLKNSLKLIKPNLVIETTRYGDYIDSIFDELKHKVDECNSIAILFGGPYSSIQEDVSGQNWDLIKLNTIPDQGTETVRTEEAVVATLSLFNFMRF
ncbi:MULTISPECIES: putative RNA uridine N3 methyltransferase [unclassified Methanobrevibacter]|jgi:predicted SPOUT superfamily RNA methylase MTH1|uniref:putative RNA uridine N3 methyltransferase n=1 Tax=unclassified Methanobrevibacter TaxID=2638681 RepID=UPI001D71DDD6|nr:MULTISPECIES: putative RNA uridine N3 methyltransferase [unclassified Methanobrevibacter]MBE6492274.1 RNA-binding protein [Methanobrevibacter sp.]MEE0942832.1 putative RNA uridine N3 methyltransferase [Methanobrevibacter sp.]